MLPKYTPRLRAERPITIEFIFGRALVSGAGIALGQGPSALPGDKEGPVRNANAARSDEPRVFDQEQMAIQEADRQFTPGQFLLEAGTVIAVCLGLGLLAQVLFG